MPLALEPTETFRVVLESDKKKPEAERPYFEFRHLSGREWRKLAKLTDSGSEPKDGLDEMDDAIKMISSGLVGWGNMKTATSTTIRFNKKRLDEILTPAETFELLIKFRNQGLTVDDEKNLDSPSD